LSNAKLQARPVAQIKVADIMSYHLVTVKERDTALLAANRLLKRGVGSVLVIDKEEHVVGINNKG
jgi:CBS domain-containing protein